MFFVFFCLPPPPAAFLLAPSAAADVRKPLLVRDHLHQELSAGHHRRHRYDWAELRKRAAIPTNVTHERPFDTQLKLLMFLMNGFGGLLVTLKVELCLVQNVKMTVSQFQPKAVFPFFNVFAF